MRTDVPIPERMRDLRRDKRGYPIPYVVMVDRKGEAHFVINDNVKTDECMRNARCHVCGQTLDKLMAFVGGPRSAFHSNGAFFDGPMHEECARYALQVCPYLALPSYATRNTDAHEKRLRKNDPRVGVMVNPSVLLAKPELFVMVIADGCRVNLQPLPGAKKKKLKSAYYIPDRPYVRTEFWRDGVILDHAEGRSLSAAIIRADPNPKKKEAAQ